MYEGLVLLIILLLTLVKGREHFMGIFPDAVKFGANGKIFTTDPKASGGAEVYSTTPDTCPPDKSDLDAGLCYTPCRAGFNGVGPVCWAESVNIGVGKPIGLEPCPDGWHNDGLICREPIRCASGWKFFTEGCSGGRLRGRLNNGGICDWPQDRTKLPSWLYRNATADEKKENASLKHVATHPDRVDGLCYAKCPADKPARIAGMPYLCYKGGPLSYGRGAGTVPPLITFANRNFSI